ncbi:hypothetical protein KKE26_05735 [bacterium]|nr:hypothetical protein [bacterium]MBU1752788.1 hypothetical protein [bacterium]
MWFFLLSLHLLLANKSELEANDSKESDVKDNNGENLNIKIEELKERMKGYNELLEGLKKSGETQGH